MPRKPLEPVMARAVRDPLDRLMRHPRQILHLPLKRDLTAWTIDGPVEGIYNRVSAQTYMDRTGRMRTAHGNRQFDLLQSEDLDREPWVQDSCIAEDTGQTVSGAKLWKIKATREDAAFWHRLSQGHPMASGNTYIYQCLFVPGNTDRLAFHWYHSTEGSTFCRALYFLEDRSITWGGAQDSTTNEHCDIAQVGTIYIEGMERPVYRLVFSFTSLCDLPTDNWGIAPYAQAQDDYCYITRVQREDLPPGFHTSNASTYRRSHDLPMAVNAEPAIGPGGVELDGPRSNLIPHSEDLSQWTAINMTVAQCTGPSGESVNGALIPSAEHDYHYIQTPQIPLVMDPPEKYHYSLDIKAPHNGYVYLRMHVMGDEMGYFFTFLNLTNQTWTGSVKIDAVSFRPAQNGYTRVTLTLKSEHIPANATGLDCRIYAVTGLNDAERVFAGDGSTVYVCASRAQFQESPVPTTYIPTDGAPATQTTGEGDATTGTGLRWPFAAMPRVRDIFQGELVDWASDKWTYESDAGEGHATRNAAERTFTFSGTYGNAACLLRECCIEGTEYDVTFTITGRTRGGFRTKCCSEGLGTWHDADGTYTDHLIGEGAYGSLYVQGLDSFDGTISNLSVKRMIAGQVHEAEGTAVLKWTPGYASTSKLSTSCGLVSTSASWWDFLFTYNTTPDRINSNDGSRRASLAGLHFDGKTTLYPLVKWSSESELFQVGISDDLQSISWGAETPFDGAFLLDDHLWLHYANLYPAAYGGLAIYRGLLSDDEILRECRAL